MNITASACLVPVLIIIFDEGGFQRVRIYVPSTNKTGLKIPSLWLISFSLDI